MRYAPGALVTLAVLIGCGGESSSERIRKAAAAGFNRAARQLGFEACAVGDIYPGE